MDYDEIQKMVDAFEKNAPALTSEMNARIAAAMSRFHIDPEFHFKALVMSRAFHQVHPDLAEHTLIRMSMAAIVMNETLDLHLAGGV